MHLTKRAIRLVTVMAAASAIALTLGTSAAMAAPVKTAPHSTTAHAAAVTPGKPKVQYQPSGCNNNNFCDYSSGNGGNLCFQNSNSVAVWPVACADHNEGEYNRNGNAVYMYRNAYYSGCWYLLYSGHYLLYNAKDHFQSGGCTGITLEHKLYSDKIV